MYSILNVELKNFIGLRKISNKNGIFNITFENDLDKTYFLIFGENGQGKTTLLENLTPFSRMFSRPMNVSIEYPAHKKIEFINTGTNEKIRIETFWKEEGHTKGYIYLNDNIEPTIETSKGNITEFNYQIEKIFGSYDKFKNSLFLQQGILEIVKSSPTERIKIINNFISDLSIYNSIKQQSVQEIEIIKSKIKEYEKKQSEYKTFENKYIQLSDFENKQATFDLKIKKIELEELEVEIKKLKEDELEYSKLNKEIELYKKEIEELLIKNPSENLRNISARIVSLEDVTKEFLTDNEYINIITTLKTNIKHNKYIIHIVEKYNLEINIKELVENYESIELKLKNLEIIKQNILIKNELLEKEKELESKIIVIKTKLETIESEKSKLLLKKIDLEEEDIEELNIKRDEIKKELSLLEKLKADLNEKNIILEKIDLKETKNIIVESDKIIDSIEKKLKIIEKHLANYSILELKEKQILKRKTESELVKMQQIDKTLEDILNISKNYEKYFDNLNVEINKVNNLVDITNTLNILLKHISDLPDDIIEISDTVLKIDIETVEKKLETCLIQVEKRKYVLEEIDRLEVAQKTISELKDKEKELLEAKEIKENTFKKLETKKHLLLYLETDTVKCDCCDSTLTKEQIIKRLEDFKEITEEKLDEENKIYKQIEKKYYETQIQLKKKTQIEEELTVRKKELDNIPNDSDLIVLLKKEKELHNLFFSKCENYKKMLLEKKILNDKIENITTLGLGLEELYNIKNDYLSIYKKINIDMLETLDKKKLPVKLLEEIQGEITQIEKTIVEYDDKINEKISLNDKIKEEVRKNTSLKEDIRLLETLNKEKIVLLDKIEGIEKKDFIKLLNDTEMKIANLKNNLIIEQEIKILEKDITNNYNNNKEYIEELKKLKDKLLNIKEDNNIDTITDEIEKLNILINLKNNLGDYTEMISSKIINIDNIEDFKILTKEDENLIDSMNALLKEKEFNNKNLIKLKDEENNLKVLNEKVEFLQTEVEKRKNKLDDIKYIDVEIVNDKINAFNLLKTTLEQFLLEQTQYQENKEWIEATLEIYKADKKEFEENEKNLYMYSKIKNYSDRIRKAFVGSFFANITETINDIISNDFGTLGNLKVEINQTRADKFDILVREDNQEFSNEVNDISLLSGAEQATVARAIYFALAQFTNFGILWLDEYDGMLSETNKDGFIKMLDKIKETLSIKQIFIISHDNKMISNVDRVVYL